MRLERGLAWGGVLAAAGFVASSQGEIRRPALPLVRCGTAVEVDGVLRCDDEAPRSIEALCGAEVGDAPPIVGGDRLNTGTVCAAVRASPGGPGWDRMPPPALAVLDQPVLLNEDSVEALESLPRIGPALALRIAKARPFASVDDLDGVRGIGPKTLAMLRPRLRLARESPR